MDTTIRIKIAADIIWIRLSVNNGEMLQRKLRSLLRMKKPLFNRLIYACLSSNTITVSELSKQT